MSSSSGEDFELIWTCAICNRTAEHLLYLEVQHMEGKYVFDDKTGETWIWCCGCHRHFQFFCVENLQKHVRPGDITEDYWCAECFFTCKVQTIMKFKHVLQMETLELHV